jgi:SAM-dependent methyltransferase
MNKQTRLSLCPSLLFLLITSVAPVQGADLPSSKRKPDVWYVATSEEIVDRMVDVARVRPGDVVYDLGCGDGRMVIAAAKKFGTRGVGVDIDPDLIRVARAKAKAEGVDDLVTFKVQDLFESDLREATVVMMYLLPSVNLRLKPKLFAELRPGARVVSHNWDMGPTWPPDRAVHLGHEAIYLWVMPERSAALAQH